MSTCATCKYWGRIGLSPIATCKRITESSDGAAMEIEVSMCGDGWTDAAFKTEADFGCTLWQGEPKTLPHPSWKLL